MLIETDTSGLVLVDTGIGIDDCRDPEGRLGREFTAMMLGSKRPPLEATARRQIEALGFSASDVRHIVLTHLDVDHAGGLPDFPGAMVHVMADEKDAAMARVTFNERNRYRSCQWAHGPRWATHRASGGERWRGFEHVREMNGLPPEILLLPLHGHTRGHACVAVETPEGPLVHCGDAYFHRGAIDASAGTIPIGLRIFETALALDRARIASNHARLRELAATPGIRLFCAHDPAEYDSLRGQAPSRKSAASFIV